MQTPEIIVVFLQNGDDVLFVNGQKVYSLDDNETGPSVQETAESLATSLGTTAHLFEAPTPTDQEWTWQDVYASLDRSKLPQSIPDMEPVAHWNSDLYAGKNGFSDMPKEFVMELEDHRATKGQLSVSVASAENVLDLIDVRLEIGRVPGSRDATQSIVVFFDEDNEACRLYNQGGKFILLLEDGVNLHKTKLPDESQGYIIQ